MTTIPFTPVSLLVMVLKPLFVICLGSIAIAATFNELLAYGMLIPLILIAYLWWRLRNLEQRSINSKRIANDIAGFLLSLIPLLIVTAMIPIVLLLFHNFLPLFFVALLGVFITIVISTRNGTYYLADLFGTSRFRLIRISLIAIELIFSLIFWPVTIEILGSVGLIHLWP